MWHGGLVGAIGRVDARVDAQCSTDGGGGAARKYMREGRAANNCTTFGKSQLL
jgi:hypothetical protein